MGNDWTLILGPVLGPLLPIVLVTTILIVFRKQIFASAGEMGEMAVARRLRNLPKNDYFVINDLMFQRRNGRTTQIDHVVVSIYGIFVIETKNISGYIYGGEYSQTWTRYWQGYSRRGRYTKDVKTFDNPVLQNGAHVKALFEELKQYSVLYVPIVVFSPKAELNVDVKGVPVIYWNQISAVIKRYKEPCITQEQAQEIYERLLALNIEDKNLREQHARNAQINKQRYSRPDFKESVPRRGFTALDGEENDKAWKELNRLYHK